MHQKESKIKDFVFHTDEKDNPLFKALMSKPTKELKEEIEKLELPKVHGKIKNRREKNEP